MAPFFELFPVVGGVIGACWLLSVLTREYSWVDRIWSVMPPVYVWLMAWKTGFEAPRVVVLAVLTTLWGARLTFNYARKGGYAKGGEDYRWGVLRQKLGPVKFQLFNATFIAPYQNILIFLITAPASLAATNPSPLGPLDVALAVAFLVCLAGETLADQHQWNFHQAKAARRARGEAGAEFCTEGLFRFSRHPNFFFEVSQWWLVYLFGVVATGAWLHWSIAGAVLLTLLFDGSTRFTESITKSKYPRYAEYQASTSRLIPWRPAQRG